ncbi:MAG: sigma-70 family RNA polymerase sigma factor [Methylobacter sp.]|nr:sigma-70 family RNA polymerase sigma factor [Methylobacter sp.]
MTYLNERAPQTAVGVIACNDTLIHEDSEVETNSKPDNTEQRNFKIASNVERAKTQLINALSQFPVTALWLVYKYDQNCYQAKEADTPLISLRTASIKYYFSANQAAYQGGSNNDRDYEEKQALITALQHFPFTFEDLTGLTDFIIYAFKTRGFHYQSANHRARSHTDFITRRLKTLRQRRQLKLPNLFKTMEINTYDPQFLFLSADEMHKFFGEVVSAEYHWLTSRQQLATANSGLVLFIANQYKGGFLDFDDLVQEGQTGLLKAIDRFDYRLGFQFSTYAGYWIRQAISRSLSRSERVVRVPCGQIAIINKVLRAKNELTSKNDRQPSAKELAEYTKLSPEEVNNILSISQTALPFEGAEDEEDESIAPIDFLEQQVFTHPFKKIAESELENLINEALKKLNSREEKVICSHFGINSAFEMTLQEIGAELNLTRERVRQIQIMALNKIKLGYGKQLMSFL